MSTMTDTETYNGYANRETWAFNLHWQNDQGLYTETLEQARSFLAEHAEDEDDQHSAYQVGEHIIDYWREGIDRDREESGEAHLYGPMAMMDREVGSWWRVNRAEVGEAVLESLDIES